MSIITVTYMDQCMFFECAKSVINTNKIKLLNYYEKMEGKKFLWTQRFYNNFFLTKLVSGTRRWFNAISALSFPRKFYMPQKCHQNIQKDDTK